MTTETALGRVQEPSWLKYQSSRDRLSYLALVPDRELVEQTAVELDLGLLSDYEWRYHKEVYSLLMWAAEFD